MKLTSTDFELFGVPARFAQDRAELDTRWKQLQSAAHPDKFAAEGAAAQRVAMQWAVRVNEAYQRLKDPLQRAAAEQVRALMFVERFAQDIDRRLEALEQ
jgi:molecular chaperone HscB